MRRNDNALLLPSIIIGGVLLVIAIASISVYAYGQSQHRKELAQQAAQQAQKAQVAAQAATQAQQQQAASAAQKKADKQKALIYAQTLENKCMNNVEQQEIQDEQAGVDPSQAATANQPFITQCQANYTAAVNDANAMFGN